VTVSTGVINARRLTFSGVGSQAVIAAYAKLPMGNYKKVVLVFDREVALGAAPRVRGTDKTHRGTSVYWYLDGADRLWKFLVPDVNRKIVITIVGGALATALDASDQVALQRTSAALIAAGVITDEATVVETYFSKWMTEPTFQGAYSYTAVGGRGGRAALIAQPLLNSGVVFAGEALFKKYGTAHGAYITGLRAAKAVVRTLPRLGFDTAANMTGE
jgi:lysine-specific histone demethylase 1